jgi:plastocyanin
MWRWRTAIALVSVALLATAPAGDTHPGHGAIPVSIGQLAYSPANISIYVGDSVLWTWNGPDTNHSVTADGGQPMTFDSDPGKSSSQIGHSIGDGYGVSFTQVGTFHYHCKVHSFMKGTITVQPAPGGPAAPSTNPPQLTSVHVKPTHFCTRCAKPGTLVSYRLDVPASMRASLRRGGRTVKEIDFSSPPGTASKRLPFKKVRAGKYVLRLVAIDNVTGKTSKPSDTRVQVLTVARSSALAFPPVTCGQMSWSGTRYVVKSHGPSCPFAIRGLKGYLAHRTSPHLFSCRKYGANIPAYCVGSGKYSKRYFFASRTGS